jgi:hypothetical protein
MDSLLSYLLFRIAIQIMVLELLVMLACCLMIVVTKLLTRHFHRIKKQQKDELSSAIESALFPVKDAKLNPIENFSLPKGAYEFKNWVEVLESFEQRFTDERWIDLKKQLIDQYVVKDAKYYVLSNSWIKRQLSARAFLLYPEKASEEELSKLINDPKHLVRVFAAVAITKLNSRPLFYEVLRKMSEETPLSRFFYRDALVQCDQEKFNWMEDLLNKEQDPNIIAMILDVLSTRCTSNLLSAIKPYTHSPDRTCRILAIRALGNLSADESILLLMEHLEDSDWEIRSESIQGLKKQHVKKAIPQIAELLNDPIWWVRLQAANALKTFGEDGKKILENQDPVTKPLAHEIAAYTLALA